MKKTFILQTDVCVGILSMLNDRQAGILFRLIIDYESGNNTIPVDEKMTPTDDMNINMAYAIVRAGLDANQRSYEDICEARREAGRKGGLAKISKSKQNKQKQANATNQANVSKTSKSSKSTYNENKEPKGSYDIIYNNKKKSSKEDSQKETDVSFSPADFVLFFNGWMDEENAMIPRIKSLSDNRKKVVGARIREHGKEALATVVRKAAASDFLNGKNGRDFVATFDWLMKPTNFPKVLEGNYDNHEQQKAEKPKDAITTDARGLVNQVMEEQRKREEEDRKRILETYELAQQGDKVAQRLVDMMRQSGKLAMYNLK